MIFLYLLFFFTFIDGKYFNPFADEDLFAINWAGSIDSIDALKKVSYFQYLLSEYHTTLYSKHFAGIVLRN